MTMSTDTLCWWALVVATAVLVASAVMLPASIMEGNRVMAWLSAGSFVVFSVLAVGCFWKLWDV